MEGKYWYIISSVILVIIAIIFFISAGVIYNQSNTTNGLIQINGWTTTVKTLTFFGGLFTVITVIVLWIGIGLSPGRCMVEPMPVK